MDSAKTRLKKRRGGLNGKAEAKIRAGRIGGKNASPEGILGKIKSGIASNALMPTEVRAYGGRVGCHVRFHVNRGIVSDRCEICQSDEGSETSEERKARKRAANVRKRAAIRAERAKHLDFKSKSEPPQPAISEEELKAVREVCGVFIRDHRLSAIRQKLNCTWAKAFAIRRALVSFCQG